MLSTLCTNQLTNLSDGHQCNTIFKICAKLFSFIFSFYFPRCLTFIFVPCSYCFAKFLFLICSFVYTNNTSNIKSIVSSICFLSSIKCCLFVNSNCHFKSFFFVSLACWNIKKGNINLHEFGKCVDLYTL